jgi:hypothetical protein
MEAKSIPRPFEEWRVRQADREEDAAYTFGYYLIQHCRDEAMATLPPDASPETKSAVAKAVDEALHNVNDLLEGFWRLSAGANHTVDLALTVNVRDANRDLVERIEISPGKLDLPIG